MTFNNTRYQELHTKFMTEGESFTEVEMKEWQDLNMEKLFEMMGDHADVFKRLKDR